MLSSCCWWCEQVQVTKPDGRPAVNEPILVYAQDYRNNVYLAKNFTTNDMGEVHYSLCEGVTENTTSLSLNVSLTLAIDFSTCIAPFFF